MDAGTKATAYVVAFAEAFVGLGSWSVWTWRLRMKTNFRGEGADNFLKDFQGYGLPTWFFKCVGVFECGCASMLILAIMYPFQILKFGDVNISFALVGATGLLILMIAAIASHVKAGHPLAKSAAAATIAVLSAVVFLLEIGAPDPNLRDSSLPVPVRMCLGLVITMACFGMWLRSYRRGDYSLDTYNTLDSALLGA